MQGSGNTNCAALNYTGSVLATLHYDPLGRLYQINWGAIRMVYDGNAMIAEYNSNTSILRRHVHGSNADGDDPLVQFEGADMGCTGTRFLHTDPRGSVIALADCSGNQRATNSYDEYGIPDTATGSDPGSGPGSGIATKGRFRYTGQAWIPELGMYYYKARIYSPTLGRFLQTDPIGYEDQFNLYAYVANDPVNLTDPTGTCAGPAIVPCFIVAEKAGEAIVVGAAAAAALCVAYCPSAEDVVDGVRRLGDTIFTNDRSDSGSSRPSSSQQRGSSSRASSSSPDPDDDGRETRSGGGRNAQKANQDRVDAARRDLSKAQENLRGLRSQPNKTPEVKDQIARAQREVNRAQTRLRESENHSMRGKGQ